MPDGYPFIFQMIDKSESLSWACIRRQVARKCKRVSSQGMEGNRRYRML